MALLDVSCALLDPLIGDAFVVERRTQVVDAANGRATITSTEMDGFGVVCAASPNDLERLPDLDRAGRNYSVVTQFKLQGPATPNIKPDVIQWRGMRLIVKMVEPYPQYGLGFVQAIAGSMDVIDPPTE